MLYNREYRPDKVMKKKEKMKVREKIGDGEDGDEDKEIEREVEVETDKEIFDLEHKNGGVYGRDVL